MLMLLRDKVESIQQSMGGKKEILILKQKEMLDIKGTITVLKNAFHGLLSGWA